MSRADKRKLRKSIRLFVIASALSLHLGCADESTATGNGSGEPLDLQRLEDPAPTILNEAIESGEPIRYDPSQFGVKRDLTLVFSSRTLPDGRDDFRREVVEEVRDSIYAFDYGTGVVRELVRVSNEGRSVFPVPVSVDQGLVYYTTFAEDFESMRVRGVDPQSGALTSDTEIGALFANCLVAAGGDLYFDTGTSTVAARDFAGRDSVTNVETIADTDFCERPEDLLSLDGTAVILEAPSELDPTIDTIRLTALDAATGALEPTPLLSIPLSSVSLGTEGERPPVLAVEDDGLYVLVSDFTTIEVWFVPYDRRPGEAQSSAPAAAPARLARIEVPFFAEVIPSDGPLAVFNPAGLSAADGVVAMTVRIEEAVGSRRFFWDYLVMVDTQTELVDLLLFSGTRAAFVDMLLTGE